MQTICEPLSLEQLLPLIAARGRRWKFNACDLEDATQEIAMRLIDFEFDPARSNGATLRTALIAAIDKNLLMIRRRSFRHTQCMERFGSESQAAQQSSNDPVQSYRSTCAMQLEVRECLASLSDIDQRICQHFSQGDSIREIAAAMNCDWHTIQRRIAVIRDHFTRCGFASLLETN